MLSELSIVASVRISRWAFIPGGSFLMGSDKNYPEQKQVYEVTVNGSVMDPFAVTIKAILLLIFFLLSIMANAQMKGCHLLGDFGLSAGTQAPPSIVAALPASWYGASKLKNDNGDEVGDVDMDAFIMGLGGSIVTNLKILNANYGASVLVAVASNRIEGNKVQESSSLAFTDMFVQPVQLGWHTKRADFTAGYSIYIPTGKYEYKGDDNKGLGMWGHEFSAGSTVYFDAAKTFHISALGFYELHSKKKDSEAKTGDIVTVEGGLGKTFYKKIESFPLPVVFNAGAIYYMQWKVSDDKIPVNGSNYTGNKDRLYSWGLEFNVLHPRLRSSLCIRWLDEVGARNRFEGNTWFVTYGFIIKSLERKKE